MAPTGIIQSTTKLPSKFPRAHFWMADIMSKDANKMGSKNQMVFDDKDRSGPPEFYCTHRVFNSSSTCTRKVY